MTKRALSSAILIALTLGLASCKGCNEPDPETGPDNSGPPGGETVDTNGGSTGGGLPATPLDEKTLRCCECMKQATQGPECSDCAADQQQRQCPSENNSQQQQGVDWNG
jgi:hypothetical protein